MKRTTIFLALAIAASMLAGCAIVPLGWYGDAGYSYRSRPYGPSYGYRPYYRNPYYGPHGYR